MSNDFEKQLKNWGKEMRRSIDVDSSARSERMRSKLMNAISDPDNTVKPATRLDYFWWLFTHSVSKPLTVGFTMMFLVFGGFMTTVNAAQSLPGEALYSVKLATEKAQLRLASLEHKAVLHTEFAGRRLDEAAALTNSTDPEKTARVTSTLAAYRVEVALAADNVRTLLNEGSDETMEVASEVDRQMSALNAEMDSKVQQASEHSLALEDARETTRSATDSVVDVMMEEHETTSSNKLSEDIDQSFRTKLGDVRARQAMIIGRLSMIERVVEDNEGLNIEGINQLQFIANETAEFMRTASDYSVAGGYRAAFDELRMADDRLTMVESRVVGMELVTTEHFISQSQTVNNQPEDSETEIEVEPEPKIVEPIEEEPVIDESPIEKAQIES